MTFLGIQSDVAIALMALLAVIVVVALVATLVRSRSRARAAREANEARQVADAQAAAEESAEASTFEQRVLDFAIELRGSDAKERVHQVIAQQLPGILGVERVWVVVRFSDRGQVIASGPGGPTNTNPLIAAEGDWATFPVKVGDQPVGVLGVETGRRPISARTRKAIGTIVPLIAEALHSVDVISQLRELSSVDPLTGCATRQTGLQRLRGELTRAHRASREVAVLLLDLDYFKSINDRFGHACGDAVLSAVGRTLMHTLRVSDIRCRWGGEEFLIVLPETGVEQAKRVGVTLARRIAETATYCGAARVQVTASVGVSVSSRDDEDSDVLIARADAALYRAKADGRNCVRILLSDTKSSPVAATPPASIPFRERRDPTRADRRKFAGFGRRKTDAHEGPRSAGKGARFPGNPG